MRKTSLIVAAILGLIGIVWFGQGIGLIHGSVMTDDRKWAVIGALMVFGAMGLLWIGRTKSSK